MIGCCLSRCAPRRWRGADCRAATSNWYVHTTRAVNAYAVGGRSIAVTSAMLAELRAGRISAELVTAVLVHELDYHVTGATRFGLLTGWVGGTVAVGVPDRALVPLRGAGAEATAAATRRGRRRGRHGGDRAGRPPRRLLDRAGADHAGHGDGPRLADRRGGQPVAHRPAADTATQPRPRRDSRLAQGSALLLATGTRAALLALRRGYIGDRARELTAGQHAAPGRPAGLGRNRLMTTSGSAGDPASVGAQIAMRWPASHCS